MNELEDRMNTEIDEAGFTFFELKGFSKNPRLALLAGCAIGYKMGVKEAYENAKRMIKEAKP